MDAKPRKTGGYAALMTATAASVFLLCASTGCATSPPEKGEVEQKANPVNELRAEAKKASDAEENKLRWYSLEDGFAKAHSEGKFVMIDFYTGWCKWCKSLDENTYTDPKVVEELRKSFVPVKIDAESTDKVTWEMRQMTKSGLANKFEVSSYPAVWFLDKDGAKAKLLSGYLPAQDFLTYLRYIEGGAYKTMEFEDFAAKAVKAP